MESWTLGVIGGSGLYALDGLQDVREERIDSPWGAPSDAIIRGRLHGLELVFLPRHGRGHALSPSDVNYRANIDVLKRAGCTDVVAFSACGSLREALEPGTFVVVDQYIDRTFSRAKSFFGTGCVAHVGFAHPVCERLSALAAEAGRRAGARVVEGGTYMIMEGPQFSTRAESELYRAWGCDLIGMTNMPEAKLAREAELPYAAVAMVTDFDCWHEDYGHVDVPSVLAVMRDNAAHARALVSALAETLATRPRTPSPQGIEHALDGAIITAVDARDAALLSKLDAVAGRVLAAPGEGT